MVGWWAGSLCLEAACLEIVKAQLPKARDADEEGVPVDAEALHDQLGLEKLRIPAAVRQALEAKGHQLKLQGDFSSEMGGGQVVVHNSATGVNYGASDPRKDGAAVPEPPPYFTPPSPSR